MSDNIVNHPSELDRQLDVDLSDDDWSDVSSIFNDDTDVDLTYRPSISDSDDEEMPFSQLSTSRGNAAARPTPDNDQPASFVSDKMDESTNLMKEIKSELALVKKENENLRNLNSAFTAEVDSLKGRVRSLEQYSRKSNIEINGIPETPKEDVSGLVRDVGVALGVEIQETDISTAHRAPSFNKDRILPLIVQFSRRTVRDTLLNKFKNKKTMTAEQINAAFPAQKIYVSEHLTPENKMFLSKLKDKCKEIGYKFAWCKDGKFFVRKCEGERFIRIENDEELNKLK
ncbi:uncharacterized protein LOC124361069 [Homalodisca vitripennis]|uniref:uncharacterized protein LOC124361069 n=1 Tax=Homalodisca vitripennis TaxID=197043 RepID=UPI001EEBAC8D|nr:uncharacterized protein LOC124361069 [Homalodisca vitripennis]